MDMAGDNILAEFPTATGAVRCAELVAVVRDPTDRPGLINDARYRLDVLKLLEGDVYDEAEPPVLVKMRAIVSEVEENERHVWHELLGELTANAMKPQF